MSDVFYLSDHEMQDIIVSCWSDPEFKRSFIENPREALEGWGILVPEDIEIRVIEDTELTRNLVIPLAPTQSELNTKMLGGPIAGSCVMSVCRPCACYKDRGTLA